MLYSHAGFEREAYINRSSQGFFAPHWNAERHILPPSRHTISDPMVEIASSLRRDHLAHDTPPPTGYLEPGAGCAFRPCCRFQFTVLRLAARRLPPPLLHAPGSASISKCQALGS